MRFWVVAVCCAVASAVTAESGSSVAPRCNAEAMAAYARVQSRRGEDMDSPGVRMTQPIARALHGRRGEFKRCHAIFGRIGVRAGTLNLQVRLSPHGTVESVCVLDDSIWDAATMTCVVDNVVTTLFPPGLIPVMFRWRLKLEVD